MQSLLERKCKHTHSSQFSSWCMQLLHPASLLVCKPGIVNVTTTLNTTSGCKLTKSMTKLIHCLGPAEQRNLKYCVRSCASARLILDTSQVGNSKNTLRARDVTWIDRKRQKKRGVTEQHEQTRSLVIGLLIYGRNKGK